MSDESVYHEVIEANITVHTRLAATYNETEPQYRPENLARLGRQVAELAARVGGGRMLDLGCGTGFMIELGKRHFGEIHGVDVTPAMLARVDGSGPARIVLHEADTGTVAIDEGAFDLVTTHSFLHHLYDILPTVRTAYRALRPGGIYYNELDPNHDFWKAIQQLPAAGSHDPIVRREIEAVLAKGEDVERQTGIDREVFDRAEWGKNIAGGFRAEELEKILVGVGFASVQIRYFWFLGQAAMVNDETLAREERLAGAERTDALLQRLLPLTRHLYKYVGFVAIR